jgi:hypothetical protein
VAGEGRLSNPTTELGNSRIGTAKRRSSSSCLAVSGIVRRRESTVCLRYPPATEWAARQEVDVAHAGLPIDGPVRLSAWPEPV